MKAHPRQRLPAPVGRDIYLDDGWDEGAYGEYGAYDDEELGGDDALDRAPPREYVESRYGQCCLELTMLRRRVLGAC